MNLHALLMRWVSLGDATTPGGCALLREQFRVLQKQMPILCAVLCLSILSGIGGYGVPETAPWALRLAVPAVLLAITVVRMRYWLDLRTATPTPQKALGQLKAARTRAVLLVAGYCVWGLALFGQADLGRQAYIAAFMFMGAIGFAYCLAILPAIIGPCLLLVALPVVFRLLISGNPLLICMGVNFALVLVLTFRMLNAYFEGFLEMVSSHTAILAEQERARKAEMLALAEQSKAKAIADTDALTNLPNRRAFIACLEELIVERRTTQRGFAVAMLDLDGFKPINDSFGHHVGDAILKQVGERLLVTADAGGIVARLGGDEFSILLPSLSAAKPVTRKAEELCGTLAIPFRVGDMTVRLSGSCGVALFPEAGHDAGQLLERADTALYYVKRRARPGVALFSYEMEDFLRRRSKIEQALRLSPAQDNVKLVFQPILELRTSRIRSFEALARWEDDELGAVSPAEFIGVAEQAGFIGELADKLFEKAISQATTWPQNVALSFNLSALQLCSSAVPLKIMSSMSKHGFNPQRLHIEVTETALLADFKAARSTIELLRAVGVGIILDDFGAGYSSIGYLREMAFDMIKIDGAVVAPIVNSHQSRALLKGMLDLCSAISTPCIAEKVETAAHIRLLRELDCQCAQGFAFAKPMSAEDAFQLSTNLMGFSA
jgi:diguanylate cyclase (GGDEF)-like protein